MNSTNIQTTVKVRPFIERELKDKMEPLWLVKENSIVHTDSSQNFVGEPYSFDHIFDQTTSNKEVYDAVVKPLVMSCLEGINSTIFAYGQTSSGKTHTMLGDKEVPGIIKYTVEDIFKHIEETPSKNFLLRCSYLEIYNEKINDLLDTNGKDLKIRENYDQMVHVRAKEEVVRESNELFEIMKRGMKTRKIGCTDMNERSSRSHTIFKLVIQSQNKDSEGSYTESSLSLVDLAGSERVGQMNMKGERQAEGVCINKSLTTLGLVIRKLSENDQFINYRDSKLTRLLQHSLGGNSKTLIICTITLAASEETKSTLEFAQRAKFVQNRPIINEKVTDKDQLKQYTEICQDYKGQIEKLRLEKLEREKTITILEDKISNIRLFTSDNFVKTVKISKIPQRRHTLGSYKPAMEQFIDSTSDEDDQDTTASTPSKLLISPEVPTTPYPVLRIQKDLLEDSYDNLKTFTSHERLLTGKNNEIMELRELAERVRNENIELRQQNVKIVDRNKEVFDQLILLQSILEGKPIEEIRKKSLYTITEENFECLINEITELKQTNSEYSKKITSLANTSTTLHDQLKEKLQELDNQKKENEALNSRLKKNTEQINQITFLQNENNRLKSELEDVTFQLSGEQKEVENLNQQVDHKSLIIVTFQEILCKKEEDIKSLEEKCKFLDQRYMETKSQLEQNILQLNKINESQQLVKQETPRSQELSDMNATLEEILCKKEECIKSLEEKCMFLDQRYTETKSQLEQNIQKINESQQLVQQETEKSQELSNINSSLQEILREKECTKSLEEKFRFLDQRYTETKNQLEQNILQLNKINESQQLVKQDTQKSQELSNMNSTLNEIICKTEECIKSLEEKCKFLDQRYKETKSQLEQNILKINESQQLVQQETQKSQELSNMTASLQEILREKEECIKSLEEKFRFLDQRYTETKSQLEQNILQVNKIHESQQLVKEETQKSQELSNINAALQEILCKKEECIKSLEEKCKFLDQRYTQTKSQLEQNILKINESQQLVQQETQKSQELSNMNASLQEILREKEECIKSLEEKFRFLDQRYTETKSQLEQNILQVNKIHESQQLVKEETQKSQELSNINAALQEILCKKEECIKSLEEKCKFLDQRYTETKSQLEQNILKINESQQLVQQETQKSQELLNMNASLQEILREKEECIKSLEEKFRFLVQRYTERKSQLEQNILQLNKIDETQQMVKQETQKSQELSNMNATLQEILCKKEECIKSLEEKCKVLDQKYIETKSQLEQNILELNKINSSQQLVKEERQKAQELSNMHATFQEILSKKEECIKSLEDKCKFLDQRYTETKNQLEQNLLPLNKINESQQLLKLEVTDSLEEKNIHCLAKHTKEVKISKDECLTHEHGLEQITEYSSASEEIKILKHKLEQYKIKHQKTQKNDEDYIQLKQGLQVCQGNINILEFQLKLEKSKVESLTQKIHYSESEIDRLQTKVNDLIQYKQRMQEKILEGSIKQVPLPRLSDERRSLSPNELRKVKRQSIHDQRRGFVVNVNNSLEFASLVCSECKELKIKLDKIEEHNKTLLTDVEDLKNDNVFLDKENEDMLQIIKELEERENDLHSQLQKKLTDCSDYQELKTRIAEVESQNRKFRADVENLKKNIVFLNQENGDKLKMIKELKQSETELHDQLLNCKNLPGISFANSELRLLQTQFNEVSMKKIELEKELLQNKKLITKYKYKIADMERDHSEIQYRQEKVEKELRKKLEDCQKNKIQSSMEDKETQITCDMYEKYKKCKKLAQIRREEGNYLRAMLKLPPDCAVLPEDVKRQPTHL